MMGYAVLDPEKARAVRTALEKRTKQYSRVLPAHVPVHRMQESAMLSIQKDPQLAECTPDSLFASVMRSASLGLCCDGREAALVRFRNKKSGRHEAQLIPMFMGLEKLARQSGLVASIEAVNVYAGEPFEVARDGGGFRVQHRLDLSVPRGEEAADEDIIATYAMAHFTNGAPPQVEVMTREQVESVRNMSRAKNATPWVNSWGEMAKKTAVRRLCKHLPQSEDMGAAMMLEEHAEQGTEATIPKADDWQKATPQTIEAEYQVHDEEAANDGQGGGPREPDTQPAEREGDPNGASSAAPPPESDDRTIDPKTVGHDVTDEDFHRFEIQQACKALGDKAVDDLASGSWWREGGSADDLKRLAKKCKAEADRKAQEDS